MISGMPHRTSAQQGFSLVEILVGLLIGLLATLVITQVLSVFESQKRTTSGTSDAQTNGSIALYTISNDMQQAGYGLLPSDNSPLGCTSLSYGATGMTDISPVTITDGGTGAGASDSITIRYGNSSTGAVFSMVTGLPGGNAVTVGNNQACQVDDIALFINGTNCNFTKVVPTATPDQVTVTLNNVTGAVANASYLSCLGTWKEVSYGINPAYDPTANTEAYLQRQEVSYPAPATGNPAAAPSVADIVNIQAQYGISAKADDNHVNQWVDAVSPWDAASLLADIPDRNRIKAIRIAVVARNGLEEKDDVSFACSSLTATNPVGLCAWDATSASPTVSSPAPKIDLSNDPDWKRYRYRVFETIIPLRNMVWSKNSL